MAHAIHTLHDFLPAPTTSAVKAGFTSWLNARRERLRRRRALKRLLAMDDRLLEDIGLSRWELARELGYYPARPGEADSLFGSTLASRLRVGG